MVKSDREFAKVIQSRAQLQTTLQFHGTMLRNKYLVINEKRRASATSWRRRRWRRRRPRARSDYITTYAYACINNVEPDRRPVKLRAYVGRESPADCFAERENRFWPLGGPWQNGFPVTISCSVKAARMLVDIRKLPERIPSNWLWALRRYENRNSRGIAPRARSPHRELLRFRVKRARGGEPSLFCNSVLPQPPEAKFHVIIHLL